MKLSFCLLINILFLAACSSEPAHQIPELPDFEEADYYQYALASVDEVLSDDPENAEALYQRARLLLKNDEIQPALRSIRRAIDIDDQANYHLLHGRVLLRQGRNRAAFREVQRIRAAVASPERYGLLAEASLRSNYFADALAYSDSAIALMPQNYRNYLRKGQAAAKTNDVPTAEKNLLQSLPLGADATEVYGILIDMYMANDRYRAARTYLEKMLAQGPADQRVRFQQAKILRMTDQPDSAQVILYQLSADSTINQTPVHREFTELYYQKHFYDSALHYAERVLERQPEEKAVMLTAARSLDRRYRYQSAIRQYEAIIELDSLQQPETHRAALEELEGLRKKVRYLWKKKQEEEFEKLKRMAPIESITPGGAN